MVEMNYARIEIPILYCVNLDTSITKYYFSTFELPVGKLGKIDNTVDARSTRKSFPKPVSKVENQTVQTLQTREREREGAGSGMVTKAKSSEFQFARRRDPCVYLAIANIPPCKSSNPFPFFPFYPFGLFFLFLSFFFSFFIIIHHAPLLFNDEKRTMRRDGRRNSLTFYRFAIFYLAYRALTTRPCWILREQNDDYESVVINVVFVSSFDCVDAIRN